MKPQEATYVDSKVYLKGKEIDPEAAIVEMEKGALEVWEGRIPVSMQQILAQSKLHLGVLKLYSHFRQKGFQLCRTTPEDFPKYQQTLNSPERRHEPSATPIEQKYTTLLKFMYRYLPMTPIQVVRANDTQNCSFHAHYDVFLPKKGYTIPKLKYPDFRVVLVDIYGKMPSLQDIKGLVTNTTTCVLLAFVDGADIQILKVYEPKN